MNHKYYSFRVFLASLLLVASLGVSAQGSDGELGLEPLAKHLAVFGRSVPQETVFVHTDNTCYYVGDTIYFKAYVKLSTGKVSNLSELLYVELLDNDGYLVERQNIRLNDGQGRGAVILPDTLYGGYYELRAYTRWQLNWGRTQRGHTDKAGRWFYSKQMREDFFRDYEKLYSRVFAVYDKPAEAGKFTQGMTTRPMERYFRHEGAKPKSLVTFYPEGGNLVSGAECTVAYDATDEDGRHVKGRLRVYDSKGQKIAESQTESRGRGTVTFSVSDTEYTAEFERKEGVVDKFRLPDVQTDGLALQIERSDETSGAVNARFTRRGAAESTPMAFTVMTDGVCRIYNTLPDSPQGVIGIETAKLPEGVAVLTVYDGKGRVWADRMFFVRHDNFASHRVEVRGVAESGYEPCKPINLSISAPKSGTVSVAVRDAATSANTFDTGNILTEMLLASQIRGFVEQPDYYFESDDETHRRALDLLLMVQGWRRYDWREMSVPEAFVPVEPYEKTPIIIGQVSNLPTTEDNRYFASPSRITSEADPTSQEYQDYVDEQNSSDKYDKACEKLFSPSFVKYWRGLKMAKMAAMVLYYQLGVRDTEGVDLSMYYGEVYKRIIPYIQNHEDREKSPAADLSKPVTVHAEFVLDRKVSEGGERAAEGEILTDEKGNFRIQAPAFDGYCRFFCGASNQDGWKNGKQHVWIDDAEINFDADGEGGDINYPEYYVRLKMPYPRFTKPYTYYQTAEPELSLTDRRTKVNVDNVRVLDEVVIGADRSGRRRFDASKPAFVLDAYEAFNEVVDAGMCPGYYQGAVSFANDIAKTYIGDMGMERYGDLEVLFNGRKLDYNISNADLSRYDHLHFVDKVYVYTDFAPRRLGDPHYEQSNQPSVTIDIRRDMGGSQYKTFRDRHKVLWGFSECTDFYSPDYSKLPAPVDCDYRRTLYWNPDLTLDAEGKAEILFFNNSKHTDIEVSVNGLAEDGEALAN